MVDNDIIGESAPKSATCICPNHDIRNISLPILIVDDNQTNRKIAKALLKQIGFKSFLEAENGQAALDIMESISLRFVLMDIQMPVMEGTKATSLYHTRFPESNLVIIANSTIDLTPKELDEYGFRTSVAKPYKKDQLYRVIQSLSHPNA